MLKYDPKNRNYPGNDYFRISRQQNRRKQWRAINFSSEFSLSDRYKVLIEQLTNTTIGKRNTPPRLCDSLSNLKKYYNTEVKSKHLHMCFVCSKPTYSRYSIYNASLYYLLQKGSNKKKYFFDYYNNGYFGLCKDNMSLVGKRSRNQKLPTISKVNNNIRYIKYLRVAE